MTAAVVPSGSPTRRRLVRAAIDLLGEGGEDALTLRALGERCGLSRGAPYRHFADKDALVRAVAAAGLVSLTDQLREASRSDRSDGLAEPMRSYVDWALANPSWYRMTFQHRASSPSSAARDPELAAAAEGLLALVTELAVEAQAQGRLPKGAPDRLVGVLWSMLHGAVDLSLAGHAKPELETDDPRQVVDAVIGFLRAR